MSLQDSGKKTVSAGPWGGQGGSRWDDGTYSTVRQLVIAHGAGIDSILIEYDKKGCSIWSEKHGGSGGNKTDKVKLDYPDEFLTSISGYYGSMNSYTPPTVRSITIESNKRSYGPFGVEQGTHFSYPTTGGKIVGFYGRCGWYLDAIGVYLKPVDKVKPSKALVQTQGYNISSGTDHGGYSVIQASAGKNYDIVLAVRQKDDLAHPPRNNVPLKASSYPQELSDGGKKEKNNQIVPIGKVPKKIEGVVTYGPWGGVSGTPFDDGVYSGVRQINLSRNVGIVWIRVLYDQDGDPIWGCRYGGTGGFKTDKIIFDFPTEILTHITGYYGPLMYMGPTVVRSLAFHTNKRVYGPFGEEQGTYFSSKVTEGKVVGIHGRRGLFLDAIGVYFLEGKVEPIKVVPSNALVPKDPSICEIEDAQWSTKLVLAKRGPFEEVSYGVVKEPAPCGPGPWGGDGGRPWDDGVFSGVRQIFLTRLTEAICSIQIEYDRSGQSVWSVKHGGNGGTVMHRVKLEYPHEVLTCISGYYGAATREDPHKVIKSMTFYTSRGKYGPFGEEVGTFFTSTTTEGKVVGFHGRSGFYLDAIGVHMQHWLGSHKQGRSSLFKLF